MATKARVWCLFLLAAGAPAQQAGKQTFRVGVCTHFSQGKGFLPENLSLARQAGIRSIRDEAAWRSVERVKGQYAVPEDYDAYVDEAVRLGLEPLLILDYGNPFYDGGDKPISPEAVEGFVRYSEFLVRHFKGKVKLYEVWNEWDIGIGGTTPGTAETYVALLERVYRRIKAIDPSITVYGGGMTPSGVSRGWLEAMLKAGGLKHLDEVSIHTYNYSNSGRERTPESWAEQVAQTQQLLQRYSGGKAVPLTVTEMGWPTQIDRRGTPPDIAAAYVARMFLLAKTMPYLRGVWYYDYQDDGWKHSYNEDNFGLLRPDLTPKPGYFALADLAKWLGDAEYLGRADAADADIWVLRFRRADGKQTWALWSAHPDDGWQVALRASRSGGGPVSVRLAGGGEFQRRWGARQWAEGKMAPVSADLLELTVAGAPWLVTGDPDGVTLAGVKRREFPEALRGWQVLR